jgi:hypothetical protein
MLRVESGGAEDMKPIYVPDRRRYHVGGINLGDVNKTFAMDEMENMGS